AWWRVVLPRPGPGGLLGGDADSRRGHHFPGARPDSRHPRRQSCPDVGSDHGPGAGGDCLLACGTPPLVAPGRAVGPDVHRVRALAADDPHRGSDLVAMAGAAGCGGRPRWCRARSGRIGHPNWAGRGLEQAVTSTDLPDLLASAVRHATGLTDAAPRPGQERLSRDIDQVLQQGEGHVVGNAPTGTGKGIAYLVPAARLALQGRRTVVSTESLGLQHQLVEK